MNKLARKFVFAAAVSFWVSFSASPVMSATRTFSIKEGQLELPSAVGFETGTDVVHPDSEEALDHVAAFLAAKPYISKLRIENHTDGSGDTREEQALSQARALSVAKWLIEHGVACDRLVAVGFGSTKPVADGRTPDGRASNRRTVFVPAALKGRLMGGMPVDGGGRIAGDPCK